jgi:hypothetical protein
MLKNKIFTIIAAISLALLMVLPVAAQERSNDSAKASPNAAVSQTIGTTQVSLTYGRPSVNDRTIFGGLVPYDEVWRTGANESTAITFSDDVLIEGEEVSAGTYSLYTMPSEDSWNIIINDKLSWGTQYDMSEDVLRVEVDSEESFFVEQMLIYFEDISAESGNLVIHWADTRVEVQIEPAD